MPLSPYARPDPLEWDLLKGDMEMGLLRRLFGRKAPKASLCAFCEEKLAYAALVLV